MGVRTFKLVLFSLTFLWLFVPNTANAYLFKSISIGAAGDSFSIAIWNPDHPNETVGVYTLDFNSSLANGAGGYAPVAFDSNGYSQEFSWGTQLPQGSLHDFAYFNLYLDGVLTDSIGYNVNGGNPNNAFTTPANFSNGAHVISRQDTGSTIESWYLDGAPIAGTPEPSSFILASLAVGVTSVLRRRVRRKNG